MPVNAFLDKVKMDYLGDVSQWQYYQIKDIAMKIRAVLLTTIKY